jgi:hypothetical protein
MVNSNVARSKEGDQTENLSKFDLISPEDAAANVAFLQTQAESWLAVLFNVFSSMESSDRGIVGEVIASWASIAREQVCHSDVEMKFRLQTLFRKLRKHIRMSWIYSERTLLHCRSKQPVTPLIVAAA